MKERTEPMHETRRSQQYQLDASPYSDRTATMTDSTCIPEQSKNYYGTAPSAEAAKQDSEVEDDRSVA